jgi:hypothetical protein
MLHMLQYTVCKTEYGGVVARGMTTAMSEMKQAAGGHRESSARGQVVAFGVLGAHSMIMFVEWPVRPS